MARLGNRGRQHARAAVRQGIEHILLIQGVDHAVVVDVKGVGLVSPRRADLRGQGLVVADRRACSSQRPWLSSPSRRPAAAARRPASCWRPSTAPARSR